MNNDEIYRHRQAREQIWRDVLECEIDTQMDVEVVQGNGRTWNEEDNQEHNGIPCLD